MTIAATNTDTNVVTTGLSNETGTYNIPSLLPGLYKVSAELPGVSAANVNIQRDGVDASAAGRWPAGIQAATIINPDLVGEIRMILSPVDAELGRGNAQIQVQTRSGTNRFHGAAVWNVRNNALDPNTWANKRVQPVPATRDWHQHCRNRVEWGGATAKSDGQFHPQQPREWKLFGVGYVALTAELFKNRWYQRQPARHRE